jgi:hypothetical protein
VSLGGGLEAGDCPRQPFDFSIFPVDRVVEEFSLTNLDGLMVADMIKRDTELALS